MTGKLQRRTYDRGRTDELLAFIGEQPRTTKEIRDRFGDERYVWQACNLSKQGRIESQRCSDGRRRWTAKSKESSPRSTPRAPQTLAFGVGAELQDAWRGVAAA